MSPYCTVESQNMSPCRTVEWQSMSPYCTVESYFVFVIAHIFLVFLLNSQSILVYYVVYKCFVSLIGGSTPLYKVTCLTFFGNELGMS